MGHYFLDIQYKYHEVIAPARPSYIQKYISTHSLVIDNNLQRIYMGEIDINIKIAYKLT